MTTRKRIRQVETATSPTTIKVQGLVIMSLIVHMHAYDMTADLYNRLQCFWPKITPLVSVHAHDCIFRHNPIGQPNGDVLKSLKERADSFAGRHYL